jgi:uncharacterized membrane protein YvbJ
MPTCPHCGATVPEGAVYCGNCGATLNSPMTSTSSTQSQTTQTPTDWSNMPNMATSDMQARYAKAIKRTEYLSYAAAGLGIAIFVLFIAFSFL